MYTSDARCLHISEYVSKYVLNYHAFKYHNSIGNSFLLPFYRYWPDHAVPSLVTTAAISSSG